MSHHFQAPASDKDDTDMGYRLVLLSSIFSALVKLGFPWFLGAVEKEKNLSSLGKLNGDALLISYGILVDAHWKLLLYYLGSETSQKREAIGTKKEHVVGLEYVWFSSKDGLSGLGELHFVLQLKTLSLANMAIQQDLL